MVEKDDSPNLKSVEDSLLEIYSETEVAQILSILAEDERKSGGREKSRKWKNLTRLSSSRESLKDYGDELIEQFSTISVTEEKSSDEKAPEVQNLVSGIKDQITSDQTVASPDKKSMFLSFIQATASVMKEKDLYPMRKWLNKHPHIVNTLSSGLSRFWIVIPESLQQQILETLKLLAASAPKTLSPQVLDLSADIVNSLGKNLPAFVAVGVWAYIVVKNLISLKDELIDKSTAFKNIINSTITIISSYGGAVAGAAGGAITITAIIGVFWAPIGILLGAVLGSIVAGALGEFIARLFETKILPWLMGKIKWLLEYIRNSIPQRFIENYKVTESLCELMKAYKDCNKMQYRNRPRGLGLLKLPTGMTDERSGPFFPKLYIAGDKSGTRPQTVPDFHLPGQTAIFSGRTAFNPFTQAVSAVYTEDLSDSWGTGFAVNGVNNYNLKVSQNFGEFADLPLGNNDGNHQPFLTGLSLGAEYDLSKIQEMAGHLDLPITGVNEFFNFDGRLMLKGGGNSILQGFLDFPLTLSDPHERFPAFIKYLNFMADRHMHYGHVVPNVNLFLVNKDKIMERLSRNRLNPTMVG